MYQFSKHFIEQAGIRKIDIEEVKEVLENPYNTINEDGLTVYEKLVYKNNKQYLLRIFVNEMKQPPVVVTGYKTSKINKYLNL